MSKMKTAEEWDNINPCTAGRKSIEFIRAIQSDALQSPPSHTSRCGAGEDCGEVYPQSRNVVYSRTRLL